MLAPVGSVPRAVECVRANAIRLDVGDVGLTEEATFFSPKCCRCPETPPPPPKFQPLPRPQWIVAFVSPLLKPSGLRDSVGVLRSDIRWYRRVRYGRQRSAKVSTRSATPVPALYAADSVVLLHNTDADVVNAFRQSRARGIPAVMPGSSCESGKSCGRRSSERDCAESREFNGSFHVFPSQSTNTGYARFPVLSPSCPGESFKCGVRIAAMQEDVSRALANVLTKPRPKWVLLQAWRKLRHFRHIWLLRNDLMDKGALIPAKRMRLERAR